MDHQIDVASHHSSFIPSESNLQVYRVLAVLNSLRSPLKTQLPPEVNLTILSYARHYLRTSARRSDTIICCANDFYYDGLTIAGLYLITGPVPNKVKTIKFTMKSADQGWATFGGNGTYQNSHTWFEASILKSNNQNPSELETISMPTKFSKPSEARDYLLPKGWDFRVGDNGDVVWKVHNNITACKELRDYEVEWVLGEKTILRDEEGKGIGMGAGLGFLERLEPGDRVVLWARAEQAYWEHFVAEATIEIGYDV